MVLIVIGWNLDSNLKKDLKRDILLSRLELFYLSDSFNFFQLDETKTLMAMDGAAGLKVLAFKDRSELRWHHFVRQCHFIYPDENSVKGSRSLFAALLVKTIILFHSTSEVSDLIYQALKKSFVVLQIFPSTLKFFELLNFFPLICFILSKLFWPVQSYI